MSRARPRVAMLVHRFGCRFGGAEAYVEHLCAALSARYDISIIAFEYDSPMLLPFIPIHASRKWPSWVRSLFFARKAKQLTRKGYDVVHSHMNGSAGQIHTVHVTPTHHHLKFRAGPLKRFLAYTSLRKRAYLTLEQARFRPDTHPVAVSERIAHQLQACQLTASMATVITPGVATPSGPSGQRQPARASLGWCDEVVVCLMVARNPMRKGLATLIEAARHLPEPIRYLIVGADRAAFEAVAAARDVADRFVCMGPSDEVATWMQAADIFVHPTREDSFGMAPLEALAHGLPLVVSGPAHCGLSQTLVDGTQALLLRDPNCAQQLRSAVMQIVATPALRDVLSTQGRRFAQAHSWDAVADRYATLYETVISARPPASEKVECP